MINRFTLVYLKCGVSLELRQLQDELEDSEKKCSKAFLQEISALNDVLSKKKDEISHLRKQLKESEEVC